MNQREIEQIVDQWSDKGELEEEPDLFLLLDDSDEDAVDRQSDCESVDTIDECSDRTETGQSPTMGMKNLLTDIRGYFTYML